VGAKWCQWDSSDLAEVVAVAQDGARRQFMTNRPQAAGLVTEFLRDALAGGALGVPKLEVMARAAGLLSEGQSITHAKAFKTAKKSLSIRSVRNGFGDGGKWSWLLEKQPASPVSEPSAQLLAGPVSIGDTYGQAHDPKEIPADVRRIPSSWIDGVARLDYHRPFTDIAPHRWRQFLSDCSNFLSSSENWAERAAQLGWDAVALFGCGRNRPLMHSGGAGLLWAVNGGRLIELHRDWAVFELAVNGSRRVFEKRRIDAAKVTLPWIAREGPSAA
jgi:hypothetical protein